jgi:hypothetical protein
MIKMIGRFMIILLVACLVAGGIYWLVQSNPSFLGLQSGLRSGFSERTRPEGLEGVGNGESVFGGKGPRQGFEGGKVDHQDRSGVLDARTLGGIGRNLLIIALTTLAVLGIQKAFSLIQRRRIAKAD